VFGYTEHETIGQPITLIIPSDLHEEEYEILGRPRAGERIDHYETVRVTKAGERIDVSLTIWPLRDPAGRIFGCSKIARDITKAKQAAAALRRSEQRLKREVMQAKTLQSISTRLIAESTPATLYDQILGAAMELMASDAACLQMLAADETSLRLLAYKNFHPSYLHGHSAISCASSRHVGRHERLRDSGAAPQHGAVRSTVTTYAARPKHSLQSRAPAGSMVAGRCHAAASMDGHLPQAANRFASMRAWRAAATRAVRSA
jgi:PAS domain S-box-containing protein